mmetsp:Transcript_22983/g.58294  ORF Transcript_22983/g.58294 Transcript_22983/m.58294 type:complete len:91 (-) Transcript_22983:246-518(-)
MKRTKRKGMGKMPRKWRAKVPNAFHHVERSILHPPSPRMQVEVEVSAVPTATKGFASILESDSVLERDEDEEDEEEGDGQDATKVESKGA